MAKQHVATFAVRVATPEDAPALGRLARQTFAETFGHLHPPEQLEAFLKQTYAPDAMRACIQDDDMYTALLFASSNDEEEPLLCGYAMLRDHSVRSDRVDDAAALAPSSLEVKRVYVDKQFHGSGAARVLMDDIMRVGMEKQRAHVWLGVYEDNPKAQAFYRKYGFRQVGTRTFHVGDSVAHDQLFELEQAQPSEA